MDPGLVDDRGRQVYYQPNGVNLKPGEGLKADLLWFPEHWWDPAILADNNRRLTVSQEEYGFKPITAYGDWTPASLAPKSDVPGATRDGNGNFEFQLYTKENVAIDAVNNKITLSVKRIPEGDPKGVRDAARKLINWGPHPDHERLWQFTSGKAMHTNGKAGYGMGTMTFTVTNPNRLPIGCWPSVWLLGREEWPTGGEIDILEMLPLEARRRQVSSATHFGHHPTEREFDKGEIGAFHFGDKIEMKMTRTKTRVTVHARDEDARKWLLINDVDLTDFGSKGDVSKFMEGPMDLIANVAVGGSGLGMDLPGGMGRVSADPRYFKWMWMQSDVKFEIEKIGWIPEEEYDSINVPEPERPKPLLFPDYKWAMFDPSVASWQRYTFA